MKITHSTKVKASEDFVVDFKIPDDPEYWKREEKKRIQRESADEDDYYDREHGEGIYSATDAAPDIKPNGGDMINYVMFYTGPGYQNNTPQAVLKWGRSQGFDKMYWGSDTAYGMKGMYNGDTFILYKDADKLPTGYKEDALYAETHNGIISSSIIERSAQKETKKAFGSEGNPVCHRVSEDADRIEYIVSSEDMTATKWMGKYLDIEGRVKYVYFYFDSHDWDEAENEFEEIIPEPYTSCRLLGTAPIGIERDEKFQLIESASKVSHDAIIPGLKEELISATRKYLIDQGFDEEERPGDITCIPADSVYVIEVTPSDEGICAEVRAELSYNGMLNLCDILDAIVQKYDKDAYFDMVCPGIADAYLFNDDITTSEDIKGASFREIEDRWLDPPDDKMEEIDEFEQIIEVDIDADIDIDEDGSYEYESLDFAKDKNSRDGDYYVEYDSLADPVKLVSYGDVVEDIDELLIDLIPDVEGKHHLSGLATLVYTVSGLSYNPSDGLAYDIDMDVTFDKRESSISKFKLD